MFWSFSPKLVIGLLQHDVISRHHDEYLNHTAGDSQLELQPRLSFTRNFSIGYRFKSGNMDAATQPTGANE